MSLLLLRNFAPLLLPTMPARSLLPSTAVAAPAAPPQPIDLAPVAGYVYMSDCLSVCVRACVYGMCVLLCSYLCFSA